MMAKMNLDLSKLSVIVIDDEPAFRGLIRQVLETFGIRNIVCTESAENAFILIEDLQPDLAIVDWEMDGMSGLDFTRMIRLSERSPNRYLPIIMLTGFAERRRIFEARDAGINEFLAKPVSPRVLYAHIKNVILHPRPFIRTTSYFGPCRRRKRSDSHDGPDRRSGAHDTYLVTTGAA